MARGPAMARIGVGIDRQPEAHLRRGGAAGDAPRRGRGGGAPAAPRRRHHRSRDRGSLPRSRAVETATRRQGQRAERPGPPGRCCGQRGRRRRWCGEGSCVVAGDGRLAQVEITAADASGAAVLAQRPRVSAASCRRAAAPRRAGVLPGAANGAEDAERRMLALVNRDRTRRRPAARRLDPTPGGTSPAPTAARWPTRTAPVFHVSPRTGVAFDRVRRAGLTPRLVLENVGRAYCTDQAESGFLTSPGHRGNIVHPDARSSAWASSSARRSAGPRRCSSRSCLRIRDAPARARPAAPGRWWCGRTSARRPAAAPPARR